jgi:hypothetical protein
VRDFLVETLNRQVLTYQPCIFGLGLYQLSSPNSREALVQHGPFHIEHNVFVRFINPDAAPENVRSVQGFRTGWLMFLGIPLAYHNDYDIANVVSMFGKFHYWTTNDPFKCRALVYASFPSPALVPRDGVFGQYASVGGIRKSWTVALYILTADFADALRADEDQMPPDGNPHPLLGHLMLNPNLFVVPQYPEIGWDVIQQPEIPLPGGQQDNVQQMDVQGEEQEKESMIMNPSQNSVSSVNFQLDQQLLQVGYVATVTFGPVLPPDLYWKRMMQFVVPECLKKDVCRPLSVTPFSSLLLSDTWGI